MYNIKCAAVVVDMKNKLILNTRNMALCKR